MKRPDRLKKGDTVAIVSLSLGILGDEEVIHRYYIAKERLENIFGLKVVTMENTLKGSEYIYNHPESRAKDLMDAFKDKNIKAIITSIGGDDTIRILPYIDFNVIKNNPKIFMGYSDTTINHFMMNYSDIVSFYGPSILSDIAENKEICDYTLEAIKGILFSNSKGYEIKHSEYWSKDNIEYSEKNTSYKRKYIKDKYDYEVLQGEGIIEGMVLGGCLDDFPMVIGTKIWPTKDIWKDKILLLETSEDKPAPKYITWYLRNLGACGIFDVIKGIIVGKPKDGQYYNEYKKIIKKVLKEFHQENLGVIYNVNIGHAKPNGIIPLGVKIRVDLDNKKITIIESATK